MEPIENTRSARGWVITALFCLGLGVAMWITHDHYWDTINLFGGGEYATRKDVSRDEFINQVFWSRPTACVFIAMTFVNLYRAFKQSKKE